MMLDLKHRLILDDVIFVDDFLSKIHTKKYLIKLDSLRINFTGDRCRSCLPDR